MKWIPIGWVESESEPGVSYQIKRRPGSDALGCSCKAYQFKRCEKTCKHLQAYAGAAAPALGVTVVTRLRQPAPEAATVTVSGETFRVRRAISFSNDLLAPHGAA